MIQDRGVLFRARGVAEEPTDVDLIRRIRRGADQAAFERLVARYVDGVYRIVSVRVDSAHDAEDLVQDIFLAVHTSMPSFQSQSRFSTWLYRIVLNHVGQFYRRRARRPEPQALEAAHSVRDPAGGPEADASGEEELSRLRAAISELPESYRSAFLLRTAEDLSYREIAEILDCAPGTVDSRIARARALLRKKLRGT